jgi:hypothetical protein
MTQVAALNRPPRPCAPPVHPLGMRRVPGEGPDEELVFCACYLAGVCDAGQAFEPVDRIPGKSRYVALAAPRGFDDALSDCLAGRSISAVQAGARLLVGQAQGTGGVSIQTMRRLSVEGQACFSLQQTLTLQWNYLPFYPLPDTARKLSGKQSSGNRG